MVNVLEKNAALQAKAQTLHNANDSRNFVQEVG